MTKTHIAIAVSAATIIGGSYGIPTVLADNSRLNKGVVQNVDTLRRNEGCTGNLTIAPQLQLAAQWHANDVLTNRALDGGIGSDGSTPQNRAAAAGYQGTVSQTVAINPALSITGMEILRQWYYDPVDHAIMADCANTNIGVWSENSIDRTVVVAVYGQHVPLPEDA